MKLLYSSVENALREQEPELTMPYWDCTLDAVLELPRESSLFSEDFMGNGDGHVITGPFKGLFYYVLFVKDNRI